MKKNLSRTLMLTAAVMTLGAAADGQETVIANIPFSFRVAGAQMQAGKYAVMPTTTLGSARTMYFRNVATKESRIVLTKINVADTRNGVPRLIFRCTDQGGCALASVWNGSGNGWELSVPRLKPSEKEHLAVIFLNRPEVD
jgi:hypothetical protein